MMVARPKTAAGLFGAIAWLLVAAAASAVIYAAASNGLLTWAAALETRETLAAMTAQHALLAYALYIATFVLAAIMLFPAQFWIILFGAMLFGFAPTLIATWIGACTGAALVFQIGRSTLGALYQRRAARYAKKIEHAFQRDQFFYMLTMRLVPVCPYTIANIAPSLLGARFTPFMAATALGVIPYVASFSFAGARISAALAPDRPPDLSRLAGEAAPALLAFAPLPFLTIVVRAWMRNRQSAAGDEAVSD